MFGKNKCKILKEIRQKIADENDIPYVTRECTYQGECSGTCPKCEQELRYLEQQLARRQRLGKAVVVTALCAGMSLGVTGCDPKVNEVVGDVPNTQVTVPTVDPDSFWNDPNAPIDEFVMGEVEATEYIEELEGYSPNAEAASNDKISGSGNSTSTPTEGKSPTPTESEGSDPTEGLPIVLPPDEFDG